MFPPSQNIIGHGIEIITVVLAGVIIVVKIREACTATSIVAGVTSKTKVLRKTHFNIKKILLRSVPVNIREKSVVKEANKCFVYITGCIFCPKFNDWNKVNSAIWTSLKLACVCILNDRGIASFYFSLIIITFPV